MPISENYVELNATNTIEDIQVFITWPFSNTLDDLDIYAQNTETGELLSYASAEITVSIVDAGTANPYVIVRNPWFEDDDDEAKIRVFRKTEITQTYDLEDGENLEPQSFIAELDKQIKIDQELEEGGPEKSITSIDPFDIPNAVARQNTWMSFDENGDYEGLVFPVDELENLFYTTDSRGRPQVTDLLYTTDATTGTFNGLTNYDFIGTLKENGVPVVTSASGLTNENRLVTVDATGALQEVSIEFLLNTLRTTGVGENLRIESISGDLQLEGLSVELFKFQSTQSRNLNIYGGLSGAQSSAVISVNSINTGQADFKDDGGVNVWNFEGEIRQNDIPVGDLAKGPIGTIQITDGAGFLVDSNLVQDTDEATYVNIDSNYTFNLQEDGLQEIGLYGSTINAYSEFIIDKTGVAEDAFMTFRTPTQEFAVGIDDTDDSFRISDNTALGTNDRFNIDSSGKISLSTGTGVNEFSIDDTLADNSDDALVTEKAIKTYVDQVFSNAANGSKRLFFDQTDVLTDGGGDYIAVNHNLNERLVDVTLSNNAHDEVFQDDVEYTGINDCKIYVTSYTPLVGTYSAYLESGSIGDKRLEFDQTDVLTDGSGDYILFTHNLLERLVDVNLMDNNSEQIFQDDVEYVGVNSCKIYITNYTPITGQWTAYVESGRNKIATSIQEESLGYAIATEVDDLTVGLAKLTDRMPHGMTLSEVRCSVNTAPTGSSIIVDINQNGTSILSTKLSIDAGEKTSTTASVPVVIFTDSLIDDAEITFDIDQVGSTVAGKGLKIYLIGIRE